MKPTDHMPLAANWGHGVTRRAIRLRGSEGRVDAALEDMRHAMTCTLRHDGQAVTAVDAGFHRYTLQICPGASEPLKAMIGLPLTMSTADFFANGRARQNCTHMLDLAWLAMRHACRGEVEWLYEVAIPDAPSGPLRGALARNGTIVQEWDVDGNTIITPPVMAGQSVSGGLTRWLTGQSGFSELTIEECLILSKGFFMVGARRFELPEGPLTDGYRKAVTGACYGYSADRIENAIGLSGMGRDFSNRPDLLLSSLDHRIQTK